MGETRGFEGILYWINCVVVKELRAYLLFRSACHTSPCCAGAARGRKRFSNLHLFIFFLCCLYCFSPYTIKWRPAVSCDRTDLGFGNELEFEGAAAVALQTSGREDLEDIKSLPYGTSTKSPPTHRLLKPHLGQVALTNLALLHLNWMHCCSEHLRCCWGLLLEVELRRSATWSIRNAMPFRVGLRVTGA